MSQTELHIARPSAPYPNPQPLPAGKLPPTLLADLLTRLPTDHAQLLLGPAVGEDAAVIAWEAKSEKLLV
ncbi:MAG: hypothetical protein KDE19_17620, partial [Caldilineaceae bacterium]|nr:hypothetical protein [Caldilineaceae bacterium]